MDTFDGVLKDMTAGELIEFLMIGKEKQADPFFWFEQAENVLTELKSRLRNGETMDIKTMMRVIRHANYR